LTDIVIFIVIVTAIVIANSVLFSTLLD
jgi:hypothetical protein